MKINVDTYAYMHVRTDAILNSVIVSSNVN